MLAIVAPHFLVAGAGHGEPLIQVRADAQSLPDCLAQLPFVDTDARECRRERLRRRNP